MVEWVIKQGTCILHQRDLGGGLLIGGSRIHQGKSRYYLGSFCKNYFWQ